jgi:plasmid maintenance system antidote protein VapI
MDRRLVSADLLKELYEAKNLSANEIARKLHCSSNKINY